MDKNDMVKKLCEKSGISEDDARDALERGGWDMLDALKLLEDEGKIKPLTASMTTVDDEGAYEHVDAEISKAQKKSRDENREKLNSVLEKLKEIIRKSVENSLIVRRKGREVLSVPVIIVVIVACLELTPTIIAFVIGFLAECSYSVENRKKQ